MHAHVMHTNAQSCILLNCSVVVAYSVAEIYCQLFLLHWIYCMSLHVQLVLYNQVHVKFVEKQACPRQYYIELTMLIGLKFYSISVNGISAKYHISATLVLCVMAPASNVVQVWCIYQKVKISSLSCSIIAIYMVFMDLIVHTSTEWTHFLC